MTHDDKKGVYIGLEFVSFFFMNLIIALPVVDAHRRIVKLSKYVLLFKILETNMCFPCAVHSLPGVVQHRRRFYLKWPSTTCIACTVLVNFTCMFQ